MNRTIVLALLVALTALGACSGGGTSGAGSPRDGAVSGLSCADAFDPDKIRAGQDCRPHAGTYCDVGAGLGVLQREPIPCDGVFVAKRSVSAAGLSTDYLVLAPEDGRFGGILLALHYLQANNGAFSNVARLSEIAKARHALVLVPQAPSVLTSVLDLGSIVGLPGFGDVVNVDGLGNLLGRWPTSSLEPIDDFVELLEAVVVDARGAYNLPDAPLYAAGLSNGAVMAYHFACRASDRVKAVLAVAGELGSETLAACEPSHPVGSVVVHGTADLLTPYEGLPLIYASIPDIHGLFKDVNGCSGADSTARLPTSGNDPLIVEFSYSGPCASGRRSYLVTVHGGGHNWPGGEASDSLLATLGLLGPHTLNFDASVQGYDLLRLAAGD